MSTKARAGWRTKATTYCTQAEAEMKKLIPCSKLLRISKLKLEEVRNKLQEIEESVMSKLNESTSSADGSAGDDGKYEEYDNKILLCIADMEEKLKPQTRPPSSSGSPGGGGSSAATVNSKSYYFPRMKLREFSGELTDWLGFWDSFKIVHEDSDMDDIRKFQFLMNCMVTGSKAREVVESYPLNAANYTKAVEALQSHFGNKKLLQLVYVRELLSMSNMRNREESLSTLYNKLKSRYEALQTLGVTTQQASIFLYAIVESCLSEDVMTAWQRSTNFGKDGSAELPPKSDMDYLMEFLQKEVENETQRTLAKAGYGESSSLSKSGGKGPNRDRRDTPPTAANLFGGEVRKAKQRCVFCDKDHQSSKCWKAEKMSTKERHRMVLTGGVCFSCLQGGHMAKSCKADIHCVICLKKGHLGLMCKSGNDKKLDSPEPTGQAHLVSQSLTKDVQLYTLNVQLKGSSGNVKARLLFDCGCQRSYVKRSTIAKLGVVAEGQEEFRKSLFGGQVTESKSHNRYRLELQSADGKKSVNLEFLEEDKICAKIGRVPPGPWIEELAEKKVKLSDMGHGAAEVELLIGGDQFGQLLTNKVIQLECGLTAIETNLGWTVGGRFPVASHSNAMVVTCLSVTEFEISQLWDLETIGIRDDPSRKSKAEHEEEARQHFEKNVTKDKDGRYCVALPWKNGEQKLPTNRVVAEKRLESATKKLLKEGYLEQYNQVFLDWEKDGIIEMVQEDTKEKIHYLPHRAVIKESSATTPVRPVFDGSCKSGRNPSLNDLLEVGPNLLELIPSILLRFRSGRFGITADIRKAFLMVGVSEEDCDYLRFLWWEDPKQRKSYKIYRHRRVVFGVNSSPFLLGAVINHQLDASEDKYPSTCSILRESYYVDNVVCSVDSKEEQDRLASEATLIMGEVKMELTQWGMSPGGLSRGVNPSCGGSLKVLGMRWLPDEDCLMLDIPEFDVTREVTKRNMLSDSAKVFDPLGLVCAVMVQPKIMLQKLWKDKISWDKALIKDLGKEYLKWLEQVPMLNLLKIPRHHFKGSDVPEESEIHVFSDASYKAYSAVIFVRFRSRGETFINLLQAKSRVAPTQKMTIPRLELLGCYIAAKLTKELKESLHYEHLPTQYWSDSTTALAWIKRNNDLGTFVGNRVAVILESSSGDQWRHVPGKLNPADLPSRGCGAAEFIRSQWWEGPNWLKEDKSEWPPEDVKANENEVALELKRQVVTGMLNVSDTCWYKFSNYYSRNVKGVAWLIRFLKWLRSGRPKKMDLPKFITTKEYEEAENKLLHLIQEETFTRSNIINGNVVERDDNDLIRVRTAVMRRKDKLTFRLPVLLPHNHPIVETLVLEVHKENCHGGAQVVQSVLREKFWLLKGKKTVRAILRRCVRCRRFQAKGSRPPPIALPEDRVKDSRVFQTTGVDLCGPLYLKGGKKIWVVLFTCAVYRAVHLEMVTSISTECFLDAFQLFVDRRGKPETIYSDNGTNFHGAVNVWKKLNWERIVKETSSKPINWKFSPPTAAWWGGFWERLIQSIKDLLKRMLGTAKLSETKLRVCLTSVERVVNSRPLTTVSEDLTDLVPLTPAMFIIGEASTDCPEAELIDTSWIRTAYSEKKSIHEMLQSRFRKEYLSQLLQRAKNLRHIPIKVGDVVFLGSDDKKRQSWPLGIVIDLLPGEDGIVRTVRVRTELGEKIRPVARLYPTEISAVTDIRPEVKAIAKRAKILQDKREQVVEDEPKMITRAGRIVKKPTRLGF